MTLCRSGQGRTGLSLTCFVLIIITVDGGPSTPGQELLLCASKLCRPTIGQCVDKADAGKVLEQKLMRRPLTAEEQDRLNKYTKALGDINKLCLCKKENTTGLKCDKKCPHGSHGYMCLMKKEKKKDSLTDDITCGAVCPSKNGQCKTAEEVISSIEEVYGILTPAEKRMITNPKDEKIIKYYQDGETDRWETCYCRRSGYAGAACNKPCPAGTGGRMCITGEQCADVCTSDNGDCVSVPKLIPKLQQSLKRNLSEDEVQRMNNELEKFEGRGDAQEVCYCGKTNHRGKECLTKCPSGFGGPMCIVDLTKEEQESDLIDVSDTDEFLPFDAYEAKVNARAFYQLVFVSEDGDFLEELEQMKKDTREREKLKQEMRDGVEKTFRSLLAKSDVQVDIEELKVETSQDKGRRRRRQVSPRSGVDVRYGIFMSKSVASRPNIQRQVANGIKKSGKKLKSSVLPGLKLDRSSVKVSRVKFTKGEEDDSVSRIALFLSFAGLAVVALLLMAVIFYKTRQRKSSKGRGMKQKGAIHNSHIYGKRSNASAWT